MIWTMSIHSLFFYIFQFLFYFFFCLWRQVQAQPGCACLAQKPSQIDQNYILLALYETPGEFACWWAAGRKWEYKRIKRKSAIYRQQDAVQLIRHKRLLGLSDLQDGDAFGGKFRAPMRTRVYASFHWQEKDRFLHIHECIGFCMCPTCVCCLSKDRESLWSAPCLPWQPTSNLHMVSKEMV